ncbi:MAG: manganese efflux pump MntP family protein [Muricoprocola sp.]
MGFWELIVIAIGVSMDAFAVSICKGLSVEKVEKKHLLSAGLWFGGSQALMPLLGYLLGSNFKVIIERIDHWIAFALLAIIGINMIRESRGEIESMDASFSAKVMFPLAIADSIDALAVGITFAFLEVNILPAISLIGVTTFLFSVAGILIGNQFGSRYKSKAEFAGGMILIGMGLLIVLEHTGIL